MAFVSVNGSTDQGLVRGKSRAAHGRRPCRRAPARSTSERIASAWHHSQPLTRHAAVAACATSVALVLSMRSAVVAGTTAVVGLLLAAAALVDSHERRLPNRLLALALAFAIGGAVLSMEIVVVQTALVGMAVAGGLMLLVRLTRGVGIGDVKMAAAIGASTGAGTNTLLAAPIAIAMAAFAAATYGFITNRRRVALGPALWFGWASALALNTTLASSGWLT